MWTPTTSVKSLILGDCAKEKEIVHTNEDCSICVDDNVADYSIPEERRVQDRMAICVNVWHSLLSMFAQLKRAQKSTIIIRHSVLLAAFSYFELNWVADFVGNMSVILTSRTVS